jgi:tetratricopeptide (TPR) repeat protein
LELAIMKEDRNVPDAQAALAAFRKQLEEEGPSMGVLNGIGYAQLSMGNALLAKEAFDEALSLAPDVGGVYALAGLTRWLLGERAEAIATWERGLNCDFQDVAGGMTLPLLLFFAALRVPDLYSIEHAKELVQKGTGHPWAHAWPGPIGLFVVGAIDQEQLTSAAVFEVDSVTRERLTQAEFYFALKALMEGREKWFREHLKRCAEAKGCEVLEEVHLARHELGMFGPVDYTYRRSL